MRTAFGIGDSPEGLTELRRAATLMVTVYYSKRMEMKIGKGKACVWESRKSQK